MIWRELVITISSDPVQIGTPEGTIWIVFDVEVCSRQSDAHPSVVASPVLACDANGQRRPMTLKERKRAQGWVLTPAGCEWQQRLGAQLLEQEGRRAAS